MPVFREDVDVFLRNFSRLVLEVLEMLVYGQLAAIKEI